MKVFVDKFGKEYNEEEVEYVDVDTPGAQFLGYVTKDSYSESRCINDWIEVERKSYVKIT